MSGYYIGSASTNHLYEDTPFKNSNKRKVKKSAGVPNFDHFSGTIKVVALYFRVISVVLIYDGSFRSPQHKHETSLIVEPFLLQS